jgi:hypothetical protein
MHNVFHTRAQDELGKSVSDEKLGGKQIPSKFMEKVAFSQRHALLSNQVKWLLEQNYI